VAGAFFGHLSEKPFQIHSFGQTSSPKVTKSHKMMTRFEWRGGENAQLQGCSLRQGHHPDVRAVVCRLPAHYRHLEEMMQERGVSVDHATINRWVLKYSPQLDKPRQNYLSARGA
jgi:hypothetical protein